MALWHGYWAIENVNLNDSQCDTLRGSIADYFRDHQEPARNPAELLQVRVSLDMSKAILEAKFNDAHLTVERFKDFLGDLFSIDPLTIGHGINNVSLGGYDTPVATFSRGGTDYIHVAFFAGVNSTRDESHAAVWAYLDNNRAEWDLSL